MADGLKRAILAARSTQPRQVYLQREQRELLLRCVRIAAEDGSIYGGYEPDDPEYARIVRLLDDLEFKLKDR